MRTRSGALRLARQASGGAAGDSAACRRARGAVHHRHPDRHRRNADGTSGVAGGDPRAARTLWPYRRSHRAELPRQAEHQAGRCAGSRSGRPAMEHRRGAADPAGRRACSGAAKSVAWRLSETHRRRHRRLGRRVAGNPRPRESGSAVAADRRACPPQRGNGQDPGGAPAGLSVAGCPAGTLVRAEDRHACAADGGRRRLGS